MVDRINRIGIQFDVRGANQYTRQVQRAVEANVNYGRSLPLRQMQQYNQEVTAAGSSAQAANNRIETFSNTLVRAERASKQARLGFTQFRRQLNTSELNKYSTEIGRLDHLLGSANRTLRITNQELADRGFDRLNVERASDNVNRHLGILKQLRVQLHNTFDSRAANNYIQSLELVEKRLEAVRNALQLSSQLRSQRRVGPDSVVDVARLSRELRFPREIEPDRRERFPVSFERSRIGRRQRDVTAIITENERRIRTIDRAIQPIEQASERTALNLQRITKGGTEAISDIRHQQQLYEILAQRGSAFAQQRLSALQQEENFIHNAIAIRDAEAKQAKDVLEIARLRTAEERLRLTQENETIRLMQGQLSIGRALLNLGRQSATSFLDTTKLTVVINQVKKLFANFIPLATKVVSRVGAAALGGVPVVASLLPFVDAGGRVAAAGLGGGVSTLASLLGYVAAPRGQGELLQSIRESNFRLPPILRQARSLRDQRRSTAQIAGLADRITGTTRDEGSLLDNILRPREFAKVLQRRRQNREGPTGAFVATARRQENIRTTGTEQILGTDRGAIFEALYTIELFVTGIVNVGKAAFGTLKALDRFIGGLIPFADTFNKGFIRPLIGLIRQGGSALGQRIVSGVTERLRERFRRRGGGGPDGDSGRSVGRRIIDRAQRFRQRFVRDDPTTPRRGARAARRAQALNLRLGARDPRRDPGGIRDRVGARFRVFRQQGIDRLDLAFRNIRRNVLGVSQNMQSTITFLRDRSVQTFSNTMQRVRDDVIQTAGNTQIIAGFLRDKAIETFNRGMSRIRRDAVSTRDNAEQIPKVFRDKSVKVFSDTTNTVKNNLREGRTESEKIVKTVRDKSVKTLSDTTNTVKNNLREGRTESEKVVSSFRDKASAAFAAVTGRIRQNVQATITGAQTIGSFFRVEGARLFARETERIKLNAREASTFFFNIREALRDSLAPRNEQRARNERRLARVAFRNRRIAEARAAFQERFGDDESYLRRIGRAVGQRALIAGRAIQRRGQPVLTNISGRLNEGGAGIQARFQRIRDNISETASGVQVISSFFRDKASSTFAAVTDRIRQNVQATATGAGRIGSFFRVEGARLFARETERIKLNAREASAFFANIREALRESFATGEQRQFRIAQRTGRIRERDRRIGNARAAFQARFGDDESYLRRIGRVIGRAALAAGRAIQSRTQGSSPDIRGRINAGIAGIQTRFQRIREDILETVSGVQVIAAFFRGQAINAFAAVTDRIRDNFQRIVAGVQDLGARLRAFGTRIVTLFSDLRSSIGAVIAISIPNAIANIRSRISGLFSDVANFIGTALAISIPNAIANIRSRITRLFNNVANSIRTTLTETIPNAIANIRSRISGFFSDIANSIGTALAITLPNAIANIRSRVSGLFSDIANSIGTALAITLPNAIANIRSRISGLFSDIANFIGTALAISIPNAIANIRSRVTRLFNDIANSIRTTLTETIPNTIANIRRRVSRLFNRLLVEIGYFIFTTLTETISNAIANVRSRVTRLFSDVANFIGTTLAITIPNAIANIRSRITRLFSDIANFIGTALAITIPNAIANIRSRVSGLFSDIANSIGTALAITLPNAIANIRSRVSGLFSDIANSIGTALAITLPNAIANIRSRISGLFSDLANSIGTTLAIRIPNGLENIRRFITNLRNSFQALSGSQSFENIRNIIQTRLVPVFRQIDNFLFRINFRVAEFGSRVILAIRPLHTMRVAVRAIWQRISGRIGIREGFGYFVRQIQNAVPLMLRFTGFWLSVGKNVGKVVLGAIRLKDELTGIVFGRLPRALYRYFIGPDGFFDRLRSTEVQLEKLDARLRDVGRSLIAPTERIQLATSKFQLLEAETNLRLAELGKKIDELDRSKRIINELRQENENLRAEELRVAQTNIAVVEAASKLQTFESREVLANLPTQIAETEKTLRDLEIQVEALESITDVSKFADMADELRKSHFQAQGVSDEIRDQVHELIQLREQIKVIDEDYGGQIAQFRRANKEIQKQKDLVRETTEEFRKQLDETNAQIAQNNARIAQTEARRSRRTRDFRQERLEHQLELGREKQIFQIEKARFNLAKAKANQEKTNIDIRKAQLNLVEELGNPENSFASAVGATLRAFQGSRTKAQREALVRPLGKVDDISGNADAQFNLIAQNIGLVNDGIIDVDNTTGDLSETIQELDGEMENFNNSLSQRLLATLRSIPTRVKESLTQTVNNITDRVTSAIDRVVNLTRNAGILLVSIGQGAISILGQATVKLLDIVVQIPAKIAKRIPIIGGIIEGITDIFRFAVASIGKLLFFLSQQLVGFALNTLRRITTVVRDAISNVTQTIRQIITNIINSVQQAFQQLAGTIVTTITNVVTTIGNVYRQIFNTLIDVIRSFVDRIIYWVGFTVGYIESTLRDLGKIALEIIIFPINAVVNLIRGMGNAFISIFRLIGNTIERIGRLIQQVIIHPLETLGAIITAPIRALGFVLNALTFRNFHFGEQGQAVGTEYREGIDKGIDKPIERKRVRKFLRTVEASSPPKEGPFKNVRKWGFSTGESWGEGFTNAIRGVDVSKAGNQLRRNTDRSVFEQSGGVGISKAGGEQVLGRREDSSVNLFNSSGRAANNAANEFKLAEVAASSLSATLTRTIQAVSDIFRVLTAGGQSLGSLVTSLRTSFSNLSLGAVGAFALIGGALAATLRAANFKGIILGFQQTGVSIESLRKAAAGTVDDIALMRSANLALAGATLEVREALSRDLPTILEIARGQAVRTGQSVNFLFESLTTGIKRASPRLIDNTGLVIKVGEAYERMAKSLGKSRNELTSSEQQLAILDETVRAGTKSVEKLGRDTEGAGQKLERFRATITNMINRLSFGAQPALEGVLDAINGFLQRIDDIAKALAGVIYATTTVAFTGLRRFLSDVGRTTQQFLSNLLTVTGIDLTTFSSGITTTLQNIFFGFVDVFASVAGAIAGIWEVITGTITGALRGLSRILEGESPPPEGPLKNIDKGAAAVSLAWQEGFIGAGFERVEGYADDIGNIISNIFERTGIPEPSRILENTFKEAQRRFGDLDVEQLETRIKELDDAVEPFETRLGIIREHFEAISEATQTSLDAINRRISTLLQAVEEGDEAAAAEVRRLDALFGRIQQGNALEQQRLDNAAISIGLLRAQQAEERALLGIELRRKRELEKAEEAATGGASDSEDETEEPNFGELPPLSSLFPGVLLPEGTEEFTNDALARFRETYEGVRNSITGEQTTAGGFIAQSTDFDPNDPGFYENVVRSQEGKPVGSFRGNVFERFFERAGEVIRAGPDSLQEDIDEAAQNIRDALAEIHPDLGVAFDIAWEFATDTVPQILSDLIDIPADALGFNAWIKNYQTELKGIGALDIDGDRTITLGELILSFPNVVFTTVSNIANAWTDYVNRVVGEVEREQEDGAFNENLTAFDRFIGNLFNEDFSVDIGAAVEFGWSYLTAPASAGEGLSLAADFDAWWNDGEGLLGLVTAIGNQIAALGTVVISTTARLIASILGITLQLTASLFRNPETGEITPLAKLIEFAIRAAFGFVSLPVIAINYLLTTPIVDLSFTGFIAQVVGIDEEALANLPGEVNTFLTETLPTELDRLFGEENVLTALVDVGNSIRSRIHEALFGESLLPPDQVLADTSGPSRPKLISGKAERDRIQAAAESAGQTFDAATKSIVQPEGVKARARADFIANAVAVERGAIKRENAKLLSEIAFFDTEQDLIAGIGTPPSQRPIGLAGQIIDRLGQIPNQISEFLHANPDFLNIRAIIVSITGNEDFSLGDWWDATVANITLLFENPGRFLTLAFADFRQNILDWAKHPDNQIVRAIDELGKLVTGNEDFDFARGLEDIFDGIDNFARDLRIRFGLASVADFVAVGETPSFAQVKADNQTVKSIGEVILQVFSELWQGAITYVEENPQNFTLIDSFFKFITGNDEASLENLLKGIDAEIQRLLSGAVNLSDSELPPQTKKFLDAVSVNIFGVPFDEARAKIEELVGGAINRVLTFFDETPPGQRDLDGFAQALFNDPELTAGDIIPNLLGGILSIPGAIIDALAETEDFGVFEPVLIGPGHPDHQIGDTDKLPKRVFTVQPFLERVLSSIRDSAVDFFDNHKIGNAITSAFRWFSGDKDFSAQNLVDGIGKFLAADEKERNQIIRDYLVKNPNLFGITSIVKFLTGDDQFSLAGSFDKSLKSGGGIGNTIERIAQTVVDGFTGDVRLRDASPEIIAGLGGTDIIGHLGIAPDDVVFNQGNIFQRIADGLKEGALGAINSIIEFNDANENLLGLDNMIQALTGIENITAKTWFESFQASLDEAGADGKDLTFPEYVDAFLQAFNRLASGSGEVKVEDSPFGTFIQGLQDAFNPEVNGSLAWHFDTNNDGFAKAISTFFTNLPSYIEDFEIAIRSLERTIYEVRGAVQPGFYHTAEGRSQALKFESRDALEVFGLDPEEGARLLAETIRLWSDNGGIENPIVQAELERAGLTSQEVANALTENIATRFFDRFRSSDNKIEPPDHYFEAGFVFPIDIFAFEGLTDDERARLFFAVRSAYQEHSDSYEEEINLALAETLRLEQLYRGGAARLGVDPSTLEIDTTAIFTRLFNERLRIIKVAAEQAAIEAEKERIALIVAPIDKQAEAFINSFFTGDALEGDLTPDRVAYIVNQLGENARLSDNELTQLLLALNQAYSEYGEEASGEIRRAFFGALNLRPPVVPQDDRNSVGPTLVPVAAFDLETTSRSSVFKTLLDQYLNNTIGTAEENKPIIDDAVQTAWVDPLWETLNAETARGTSTRGSANNFIGPVIKPETNTTNPVFESWMGSVLGTKEENKAASEVFVQENWLDPLLETINTILGGGVDTPEEVAGENPIVKTLVDRLPAPPTEQAEIEGLLDLARFLYRQFGRTTGEILTAAVERGFSQQLSGISPFESNAIPGLPIDRFYDYGYATTSAWVEGGVDGINDGELTKTDVNKFTRNLEAFSPPRYGPFKDMQVWGNATGKAWVDGFVEAFDSEIIEDAIFTQPSENYLEGTGLVGFGDLGLRLATSIAESTSEELAPALAEAIGGAAAGVSGSGGKIVEEIGLDPVVLKEYGETLGETFRDAFATEINAPLTAEELADLIATIKPAGSPPAAGPLTEIDEWGSSVGQSWIDSFTSPFKTFFYDAADGDGNEGEASTWSAILQAGRHKTDEFVDKLPDAFTGLPSRMWDVFGSPMVQLFNYLIGKYNDFIRNVAESTDSLSQELGITPIIITGASRISTEKPDFLGAATGGTFSPGGLIVGERGPELIVPSERISVFPNEATRGLSQLGSVLQGQYQRPIYSTTNHYNTYNTTDDHSMSVRIDGRGRSDDNILMKMRSAQMRRY